MYVCMYYTYVYLAYDLDKSRQTDRRTDGRTDSCLSSIVRNTERQNCFRRRFKKRERKVGFLSATVKVGRKYVSRPATTAKRAGMDAFGRLTTTGQAMMMTTTTSSVGRWSSHYSFDDSISLWNVWVIVNAIFCAEKRAQRCRRRIVNCEVKVFGNIFIVLVWKKISIYRKWSKIQIEDPGKHMRGLVYIKIILTLSSIISFICYFSRYTL